MSFETIYQICRIAQPHFMQFLIGIRISLSVGPIFFPYRIFFLDFLHFEVQHCYLSVCKKVKVKRLTAKIV